MQNLIMDIRLNTFCWAAASTWIMDFSLGNNICGNEEL